MMSNKNQGCLYDLRWQAIGALAAIVTLIWALFIWVVPGVSAFFNTGTQYTATGTNNGASHKNLQSQLPLTAIPTSLPPQQVTPGTIVLNKRLTCNCSAFLQITINSITFENDKDRMRWDITVDSIDGSNRNYSIYKFSLHCSCDEDNPDKTFDGTGNLISAIGPASNMQNGSEASQVFFGFIPYQKPISYQLTAEIYCTDIGAPATFITFDPLTLTL